MLYYHYNYRFFYIISLYFLRNYTKGVTFLRDYFKRIIKLFKKNVFIKTYTLILLPVLIFLFFFIFSTDSYNKNYINLLKNSYIEMLESISNDNEISLGNISIMIELLAENESFMNIVANEKVTDTASITSVTNLLTNVIGNNTLIDSIMIYNRNNSTIYTNNGIFDGRTFFYNNYAYSEYPRGYWENYSSETNSKQILYPSLVSTPSGTKKIIPIVFTEINNVSTNNIVVVNVDLSKIIIQANDSKLTQNSTFLIISNRNRYIFSENENLKPYLNSDFFTNLADDTQSGFYCDINNEKTLVLSYSDDSSILGYSYIILVPYSDIRNSMSHITYLIFGLLAVVLLIIFVMIYFSTKKIYSPFESLASLFDNKSSNKNDTTDTIQMLHTSIQETLEYNNSLSKEMSKALPLVQERILISLLNSNEHYTPQEYTDNLPIDFKYEYFCSVVIKLKPTEQFYSLYNNIEYNAIKSGIHSIIQSAFSDKFDVYIIPSETDTLYVLLNLESDKEISSIVDILEEFQKVMDYDKEYMPLKIGLGGIYEGVEGLKKSHHEAINSVSSVIGLTHVRVNSEENPPKLNSYIFTINDENQLLNYLILGHANDAIKLIDEILNENIEKNISDTAIMQLYIQLLNVIFKVMRMKKISYDKENSGDFNIITEIINQPVPVVHDTVMKYLEIIRSHTGTSSTKIDIQSIITYLEDNYNKEISLEIIADNFRTTPKYLSKLIKDKLGVNFVDYLASMRIDKSKELILKTNKSISDIYIEVGFNNRNTFIRTFKKSTGLTPSEFRKLRK